MRLLLISSKPDMKNVLTLFFLLAGFTGLHAQTTHGKEGTTVLPVGGGTDSAAASLLLAEEAFDFGSIPQGKPVYHSFRITNGSASPLQLTGVQTSCGCTTPEWSKDPIAPGKSAFVKVGFNAASDGPFEKFITIQYNENSTRQVKIRGNVWKAPVGSAPPNASLQFIKQQIQ
jgi:hypothetical protein